MKQLKLYIKILPLAAELLIVILVAFGYSIANNLLIVFGNYKHQLATDSHFYFLLVNEVAVLIILGWFLRQRGWSLALLGLKPTIKDTLIGVSLYIISYVFVIIVWFFVRLMYPTINVVNTDLFSRGLNFFAVFSVCLINPLYEEIFVCAYLIIALRNKLNIHLIAIISVLIRTSYHLYQQEFALLIIPFGLIFTYYFIETRKLWPLVVAHFLWDFIGLMPFVFAK